MPGERTFSWPRILSLWEWHRVVGMRTWGVEGRRASEAGPFPQVTSQLKSGAHTGLGNACGAVRVGPLQIPD